MRELRITEWTGAVRMVDRCAVEDCHRVCAPGKLYCAGCADQIESLDCWAQERSQKRLDRLARREMRRESRRALRLARGRAFLAWVRKWAWIPELIFVIVCWGWITLRVVGLFAAWFWQGGQ